MRISMTTEKKQMFTRRITQANKTQLTVIVYEMLLAYLEDARAAHDAGQTEELVHIAAGITDHPVCPFFAVALFCKEPHAAGQIITHCHRFAPP